MLNSMELPVSGRAVAPKAAKGKAFFSTKKKVTSKSSRCAKEFDWADININQTFETKL